jgi:hypothetical protein
MAMQDVLLSSGSATFVREDAVLRALVQRAFPEFLQRTDRAEDQWGATFGRPQFWFRPTLHNSPRDVDGEVLKVEVLPLKAYDFTGTKT